MTRTDWERLPTNPDLIDDLGYELSDLEAYETHEDQVLFIPTDEDIHHEDAFILVRSEDVATPLE